MCTTIPRSHSPNVQLKWHNLRRHPREPGALRSNLEAGLAADAVMETDIRLTRDGHWICLHNPTLDEETTGTGPVAEQSADRLRLLQTRTPAGVPSGIAPTFLEDLLETVRAYPASAAELQLDLKVSATEIDDGVLARFSDLVGPVRSRLSVSGTDVGALARIREALPELPITLSPSARLGGARDATVFESRMRAELARLDGPSMIWVNHRVLQAAYRARFDLVGFAHREGVAVDTGTIDVGGSGWRSALVLALQAKVDRITTNSPCDVAAQVARWAEGRPRKAALAS